MVGVTAVLRRIPVIKFRKGGHSAGAQAGAAQSAATAAPAGSQHAQASAPMSTSAIPDFNLPAKYRRQPISEEEIAYINGGGVV